MPKRQAWVRERMKEMLRWQERLGEGRGRDVMKARVEPSACNQKSRNTACCPLLSLQPVLENVKGTKRKGSLCRLEVFNVDFPRSVCIATAETQSADTVVGRRESALISSEPPHPSSTLQHRNNQQTKRLPYMWVWFCLLTYRQKIRGPPGTASVLALIHQQPMAASFLLVF